MLPRHVRLSAAAVLVGGLLALAGCSADGRTERAAGLPGGSGTAGTSTPPTGSAAGSPSARPSESGAPKLDFDPDPARAPKDGAQAIRLARTVAAKPDDWGPGFVADTPYESDTATWPVLDTDCVWQRSRPPRDVLASLTRRFALPASGGKGRVEVGAIVTVHRAAHDADWEMAESLEEALRCPDQQLRGAEHVTGLTSLGTGFGTRGNFYAEDTIAERGSYSGPGGGRHPYTWDQARLGQVTVAVTVKSAAGHAEGAFDETIQNALGAMMVRAQSALEAA